MIYIYMFCMKKSGALFPAACGDIHGIYELVYSLVGGVWRGESRVVLQEGSLHSVLCMSFLASIMLPSYTPAPPFFFLFFFLLWLRLRLRLSR